MRKKYPWWQAALLIAFAAALAFGAYEIDRVGDHLQYLTEAPALVEGGDNEGDEKRPPNENIKSSLKSLREICEEEWATTMRRWTMGGVKETASVSGNHQQQTGRLTLIGEDGLEVNPLFLRYGRSFYPDEVKDGAKVALLDEQLALALFRVGDPLDRTVNIEGVEYRVIGIVRHRKQVGDLLDYGAYVPLMSVLDERVQLDALLVEAEPNPGMGASVSFESLVTTWRSGGSVIDLGKQGMAAGLWLRVLIFLTGLTATLRLIGLLNHAVRYYMKRYRQKLQTRYAVRLMPEMAGMIALFALGYGAAALLAAGMMNYIIKPVYTFTEWIPAVLVEWSDIADAFWKVWQPGATLSELRTPELMRLRWLTLLMQGCSAGAGVLLALLYARFRGARSETTESIHALYREGVAVSALRTSRPIAFAELGYVPCLETAAWAEKQQSGRRRRRTATQPMMRIINVRRVLNQLPVSPKEGSFVLEVTDSLIPANNARYLITCDGRTNRVESAEREWDLQLPVQTLTRILYGGERFSDFLESNAGYDMRMRSPAMDGLFDQHLPLTSRAL